MAESHGPTRELGRDAALKRTGIRRDDVLIVNVDLGEQSEVLSELIKEAKASDDWDAVADWCESIDWLSYLPGLQHEVWLDLAVRAERIIEKPTEVSRNQITEAVCWARDEGASWERIGELLGTSAAEAKERYGEASDAART